MRDQPCRWKSFGGGTKRLKISEDGDLLKAISAAGMLFVNLCDAPTSRLAQPQAIFVRREDSADGLPICFRRDHREIILTSEASSHSEQPQNDGGPLSVAESTETCGKLWLRVGFRPALP